MAETEAVCPRCGESNVERYSVSFIVHGTVTVSYLCKRGCGCFDEVYRIERVV